MDTKQPEALILAALNDADTWPGELSIVTFAARSAAELRRLQSENEQLRAGYDAALLEIESLQAQPVASDINDIVVGAIFDFMDYLTTRDELLKLSAFHEASPAVEAIEEWAEKVGLSLENARVRDWKKTSQPAAPGTAGDS